MEQIETKRLNKRIATEEFSSEAFACGCSACNCGIALYNQAAPKATNQLMPENNK